MLKIGYMGSNGFMYPGKFNILNTMIGAGLPDNLTYCGIMDM
jgi:hypothetical protein